MTYNTTTSELVTIDLSIQVYPIGTLTTLMQEPPVTRLEV